jgi:hypothetical protein
MMAPNYLVSCATIVILFGAPGCGTHGRPLIAHSSEMSKSEVRDSDAKVASTSSLTVEKDLVSVLLRANQLFEIAVPFKLHNGSRLLFGLPGCRVPDGPAIETLQNSVWRRWVLEHNLCDSPPEYVQPGMTRVDTLHLTGCFKQEQCIPAWVGGSSETLRLVYRVYPTRERINRSSELSRLPYIELSSRPFKAVVLSRPCGDTLAPRSLLC